MRNSLTSRLILTVLLIQNYFGITAQDNTNTVSDIDGNVYHTVTIGAHEWFKENLKTSRYSNGDTIGTTYPDTLNIRFQDAPKYQWAYAGNDSIASVYGRLYTWYTVADKRNICP